LPQAIESALSQSYKDYELLVVDDGSTDNTRDIVSAFGDRVNYFWKEHSERSDTRNFASRIAQGDLIAFLDSDDVWLPEKLSIQVAAFETYPEAVLAHVSARLVNEDLAPVSWWGFDILGKDVGQNRLYQPKNEIVQGSVIMPTTAMIRRDMLLKSGGFDPEIFWGEDWDLWIRMSRMGAFIEIPRVLSFYRTYGMDKELKKRSSDLYLDRCLYIIGKAASSNPDQITTSDRRKIEANIYAHHGMANFQSGNPDRGTASLLQASELDPTIKQEQNLVDLLEYVSRRIWRDTRDENQVKKFITVAIANLPKGFSLPAGGVRQILARMYMSEVFQHYCDGNPRIVLSALAAGLTNDPSWVFNRGVVSIGLKLIQQYIFKPQRSNKPNA